MSVVVTGAGYFTIPAQPAAGTSVTSGAANNFTATAIVLSASTSAMYITGLHVEQAAASAATYMAVRLMQGLSGAETSIGDFLVPLSTGSTVALGYRSIDPPIKVASTTRLSVKTADSVGSKVSLVTVECVLTSNVVDDGIAVGTVTSVTNQLTADAIATGVWQDTTAGDFTTALSVGKSVMNGVALGTGLTINAYTGNTVQTGDSFAIVKSGGTGDNAAIKAKTDLIPASPASTTNITAAAGVSLAASQHVIVDSGTVTTLSNLPSIPANWITATGITAAALNGKGDWLLSSGYTAPDNTRPANFAALAITVGGAVTAGTVSDKTGYSLAAGYDLAKTAAQAGDAMALTVSERTSVADALLNRNVSGGSSAGRLVKESLAFLRNKWTIAGSTLTVYDTDDATVLWTAAVARTAGDPVSASDPA